MLNFTKIVSRPVIGTVQQIGTKLMHPFEKFRETFLVEFYFIKDFNFLIHEVKQRKILVWGLRWCKTGLKHCQVLLRQSAENVFVFR